MPPESDKPALHALLGDESARGIELAVTPVVFGGIGWLVDGQLGTAPWFTIGLAALALVSTIVRMWFAYDADMRRIESSSRWARGAGRTSAPAPTDDVDLWSDRRAQA